MPIWYWYFLGIPNFLLPIDITKLHRYGSDFFRLICILKLLADCDTFPQVDEELTLVLVLRRSCLHAVPLQPLPFVSALTPYPPPPSPSGRRLGFGSRLRPRLSCRLGRRFCPLRRSARSCYWPGQRSRSVSGVVCAAAARMGEGG